MPELNITQVVTEDELYHRYDQRQQPQPAQLNLDLRDGSMWCNYDPLIEGGMTQSAYNGLVLVATIPHLTADAANELMNELKDLAQTVLNGANTYWNGHDDVGKLTDAAASAAWDEIREICAGTPFERSQLVEEWSPGDWYADESAEAIAVRLGITAESTDHEVEMMAREEAKSANHNGDAGYSILDIDDTFAFLCGFREGQRGQIRAQLEDARDALTKAEKERDDLLRRIHSWKDDSLRTLGELAELSHTQVARIVSR